MQDIQSSRRRRGRGGSSSSNVLKPVDRSRRIKNRKSANLAPSVNSPKNAEMQSGLIVFPDPECSHLLVLDSMASLFPLASLAKDEILTGGVAESEKDVTPNSMLNFERGMEFEMGDTPTHPSFISCTPIKPNNIVVPLLRSAFSPQIRQRTVSGFIDCYNGFDSNKENSTDQMTSYHLSTDHYSPTTPVNQFSMLRRSSPFGYECGLNQLLCSPYRQHPGVILAETRKPILFSFRDDLPVTDLTSPVVMQSKNATSDQSDSKREAESDSKPAAVNPSV